MFTETRELAEKSLEGKHPRMGRLLSAIGRLYQAQDRWNEAEVMFDHGLAILDESLGKKHYLTVDVQLNLAEVYNITNRATEARKLVAQARTVVDGTPGSLEQIAVKSWTIQG